MTDLVPSARSTGHPPALAATALAPDPSPACAAFAWFLWSVPLRPGKRDGADQDPDAVGPLHGLIIVGLNGTDSSGCCTSAQPCRTLRYAIFNASQPTDTISLLPGTYYDANITLAERNLTVSVSDFSLSLSLSTTNLMLCRRIISQTLFSLTAACNTVLFFLVYTSSLRLVGVQMQHCHYNPAIPSNVMWGGAIFVNYDATIVTESSTFVNNSAAAPWKAPKRIFCGGAVWTEGPSAFVNVNFSGNVFLGNASFGGAVCATSRANFSICSFTNNSTLNAFNPDGSPPGAQGGAVFVIGPDVLFDSCTFSNNSAIGGNVSATAPIAQVGYAAVALDAYRLPEAEHAQLLAPVFQNCHFDGNRAVGQLLGRLEVSRTGDHGWPLSQPIPARAAALENKAWRSSRSIGCDSWRCLGKGEGASKVLRW